MVNKGLILLSSLSLSAVFAEMPPMLDATSSDWSSIQVPVSGPLLAADPATFIGYQEFHLADRFDHFEWNIAGNLEGTNPNILSELTWRHIKTAQLDYRIEHHLLGAWYWQVNFDLGSTYQGQNQDSDYALDNRAGEFSRSYANARGGSTFDFSVGFGKLSWGNQNSPYRILNWVGMDMRAQEFKMRLPAYFRIPGNSDDGVDYGINYSGLNSSYIANWIGLWGGVEVEYQSVSGWGYLVEVSGHLPFYCGEGNWNLRSDFQHPVSFVHYGLSSGVEGSLGITRQVIENQQIILKMQYDHWKAGPGVDITFLSDGDRASQRLNSVVWHSVKVSLGVRYAILPI